MSSALPRVPARIPARIPALICAIALLAPFGPMQAFSQERSTEGSVTRFGATPDVGKAAAKDPQACATAYHAALKRIEKTEFATLEAARGSLAVAGDPRLPGAFLVPPRASPQRSKAEMGALATATALARSKGRQSGGGDADGRWIADRLRSDLSDYLGQAPSPFLCGGVPAYVATLRRFADRIVPDPGRRATLRTAQTAAARRSIAAAMDAMKHVAPPRFAPADRPNPLPDDILTGGILTREIDGLRPAAGISRHDGADAPGAAAPPAIDPDLPPLAPPAESPLATVGDLSAAIDGLLQHAQASGFVTAAANQMAIGGHAGLSPLGFPVLSRIAKAREYVSGPRPLVGDVTARLALAAALSDIEALDYLLRAEAQPGDPTGTAIHATLDAIVKAHAAECTCGK